MQQLDARQSTIVFAIYLDSQLRLLEARVVSIGTRTEAPVDMPCVFRPALMLNASQLILAHTHPSGDLTFCEEDVALTQLAIRVGEEIGIRVLDHFILNESSFNHWHSET
jgi:DNA repair protein RadC